MNRPNQNDFLRSELREPSGLDAAFVAKMRSNGMPGNSAGKLVFRGGDRILTRC
jgi:hypothetical protein